MQDLNTAKLLLEREALTCALVLGSRVHISTHRGVRPLLDCLDSGVDFRGYSAADKVVGKATAYLYVLLRVQALHAKVISQPAMAVLQSHGIAVSYETLVPNIINRRGDGICPFELAVTDCADPDSSYAAILRKMDELHIPLWD